MHPYLIFLGLGLLFVLAGFLGLAGGIVGIVLWAAAALFFILGFIAFVLRAKSVGKPSNEA